MNKHYDKLISTLRTFLERYFKGADFVSLRYYASKATGKVGLYAIPYNGEEFMKCMWEVS
ncbi:MAG: hypothetical protein DSY80_01680 [Desulfocapsa sp.]|nr:MAG: hypothetical protein DSY80_01680 [Desulfocapsa sp.]